MPDLIPWWNLLAQPGQQYGPDPDKIITAQKLAEQMRMQRQTNQGYNSLGALYANPGNIDEKGNIKPDVMNQFISMFPQLGLEVQGHQADIVQKQARSSLEGVHVVQAQQQAAMQAVAPIYEDWLTEKARNGGDENKANQALQERYTEFVENCKKGGQYSAICNGMPPNMDGARMGRNLMGLKGVEEQQKKATTFSLETDYGREPHIQYKIFRDGHYETMAGQPYVPSGIGAAAKGAGDTQFHAKVRDADTGQERAAEVSLGTDKQYRDNAGNLAIPGTVTKMGTERAQTPAAQAFSKFMDENQNATSAEQIKFIESQRPARSGPAAAVRKFMVENPNASANEIAAFNAWQRETSAGAQAFGTGTQGNLVRTQDVGVDHLAFLSDDLIPALNNGDVQAVNRLKNWAKTEFGYEGPVDFNFAKGIVSQEVNKAIVNVGAGTELERGNLAKGLSDANSPEQLNGVIRSAKRLMAGQLRGLQKQYVDVSVPPDKGGDAQATERARLSFQQKLFPRTIEELGGLESKRLSEGGATAPIPPAPGAPASGQQQGPAQQQAMPPIDAVPKAQRRDGTIVTFADEKGVQHRFVVINGGKGLMPAGQR